MSQKFEVGQWVFCEFALHLIREMKDGRVTEVTDAVCSHSGYDLTDRCRPLTYEMKQIADSFKWESERIHREGSIALNYPDIHRWLVDKWCAACDAVNDRPALEQHFKEMHDFATAVVQSAHADSGYGFPLFRRRA